MDKAVQKFLKAHPDFSLLENGKVRCSTTEHEMPARLDLLEQHLEGKRYRLKKASPADYDFSQHEPHIIPHKRNPALLHCTLTKITMQRLADTVRKHVAGKRFQKALASVNQAASGASKADFWQPEFDSEDDSADDADPDVFNSDASGESSEEGDDAVIEDDSDEGGADEDDGEMEEVVAEDSEDEFQPPTMCAQSDSEDEDLPPKSGFNGAASKGKKGSKMAKPSATLKRRAGGKAGAGGEKKARVDEKPKKKSKKLPEQGKGKGKARS